MAQKTDLNVAPYYDDFDKSKNYNRVLFRPGFAVQARELTQLQSALQNQIEAHGNHIFKEGAMVIPGQISYNNRYYSLKLENSFSAESIDVSQYYNATTPVTIEGVTSGVKAQVIGVDAATTSDQATLYLIYSSSGGGKSTGTSTSVFQEGENIKANVSVTHTSAYAANIASATVYTKQSVSSAEPFDPQGPANRVGSAAQIQSGVYYIRGMFVETLEETLVLDKYNNRCDYRVGFEVTETIATPETDSSLTDNAAGTSNFAAKGGHRLGVSVKLAKKALGSTDDANFIELMTIKKGKVQSKTKITEYQELEETFARRTFDESGNYTVRPFQFEIDECLTINENEGVFQAGDTTDDGNLASKDLLAFKVSPGKAYIKGIELEKLAPTYKDIKKSRQFDTINAGVSAWQIGNYAKVTKLYGTPEVGFVSGQSTSYKEVILYDTQTSTRGSASGTAVGVARVRAIQYESGTAGATSSNTTSVYRLYLFDIRPFTKLTLSGTPSPTLTATHSTGGVKLTGETSGATGFVYSTGTSGSNVNLTNVVGSFSSGEKLIASDSTETGGLIENSSNTDLTVSSITENSVTDSKSIWQDATTGSADDDFTCDIQLDDKTTLSGTYRTETSGTDNLIGVAGYDTSQVKVGDVVTIPTGTAGATEDRIVDAITATAISFTAAPSTDGLTGSVIRNRAKIYESEKNLSLVQLSKKNIKTVLTEQNSGASDTQFTVRRQFVATSSSGVISLSAGSNETFVAHSEADFSMSILDAGSGGSGVAGDVVSASTGFSGNGTATLTINNNGVLGDGAKVRILATLLRTSVTTKTKAVKLSKQLKVAAETGSFAAGKEPEGTRPSDKIISLGRSDVIKVQAVFDSEDTSTDAIAPELAVGTITGTFTRGEEITGGTSGAKARIITTTSPIEYVLKGTTDFSASETITGTSSSASCVVSTVTAGDTNILSNYLLDTGQRDNFYDISRIQRKAGAPAPTGRLLVVYDYLEHGAGDAFTVDSYVDIADQMTYEDIPIYTATKVDPDAPQPTGSYRLQDVFDFRPAVADITGTSATISAVDQVGGNSFDFQSRTFSGTGSSSVDWPKPQSNVQADFEFYLGKRAMVFMNRRGNIIIVEGTSAEIPVAPKPLDGAMLLATLDIPAYTFTPDDVTIKREKNQRFTMKDIGKLKNRLEHVEYYTALNMLERDAESFQIQDSNGLDRFKSGFIVDNFSGHSIGDVANVDYKCAIDMEHNELRPKHKTESTKLIEQSTTDTQRASQHYQKTGDLLTLPYTEVDYQDQPFSSRLERVTPVLLSSWIGDVELSPAGDEWIVTEIAPKLIVNVEGNFDTFLAANQDKIGTVWNAWQTQWSGVVSSSSSTFQSGNNILRRTSSTSRTDLARTGIQTEVVAQVDEESQGTRVVNRAIIPFMRAVNITFTGTGFLPNTRLYCFFDKKNVNAYVTPLSGFTTDAMDSSGQIPAAAPLITTAAGKCQGILAVPDPTISGNPTFTTGEVQFRLTSSSTNVVSKDPETAGETIFFAKGLLETEQETIIATRNARLVRTEVNQTTSVFSSSSQLSVVGQVPQPQDFTDDGDDDGGDGGGGTDPLAQTFFIENQNGSFLTSIDVYFGEKDADIPVALEVRNTVNGYPGPKILPFGRVVLEPNEVTTSDDASIATTFKFPSPVYVEQETEYCFCLLTNMPTWKVWISRMGETETSGTRTISEQPHVGTMFKSHNNRGWAASLMEDIKFKIKVAKFDTTSSGVVTLNNEAIADRKLTKNPITFTDGNTALLVRHRDHHMYSTSNNVTISGVVSGLETTLNGTITATATSLALTSGANFNLTSGRWSKNGSNEWHIKIDDEIMKYTGISGTAVTSITRGVNNTTAASHADGAKVEFYQLHKVPLYEINKTHTALANINIDSYTVALTTSPVIGTGLVASNGGDSVLVSQNYQFDTMSTMISTLELAGTEISAKIQPTSGTSPNGTESSFQSTSLADAITIPLNDNHNFLVPKMIASPINETNEMSGTKSLSLPITMSSTSDNISPVIDIDRMSILTVSNRLNEIASSSDVYPAGDFAPSTEPEGDNNAAIYMTRKVTLETPATALRVLFAANRHESADIKVLFKTLRSDDASDFDEIGYTYFNSDGSPDVTTNSSLGEDDFQQYTYTAGVTDDGIGTPLPPFIGFSIKIVMTGTNSAQPPRIKDFRGIALAT